MDPSTLIIRPAAPEPIYRQIVEQLRRLISSGQLAAGEELPSVRDVAGQHAINPMTVSRAYSQLEAEGLLERRRGKGMVVCCSRRTNQSDERRLAQIEPRLQEIVRQGRELKLPDRIVLEKLKALMEKEK